MAVESEMVSEVEHEEKLREKLWVSFEVSKESKVDPETGVRGTGRLALQTKNMGLGDHCLSFLNCP